MKNLMLILYSCSFSLLFLTIPNKTKSQEVIKQRLDSAIYIGENRMAKYFYDSFGNNSVYIDLYWKSHKMNYVEVSKYEYTYDSKGNCLLSSLFVMDTLSSEWYIYRKIEQSFDNNNQLLLTKTYELDQEKNELTYRSKVDYENEYDTNNRLIESILYANSANGLFLRKYQYTYNPNGKLLTYITQRKENNVWINGSKHEFNYDNQGNVTEQIYYSWAYSNNNWKQHTKIEYNYNYSFVFNDLLVNQNYSSFYIMDLLGFHVNHMITNLKIYHLNSVNWELTSTRRFYYSPMIITGINEPESLKTTIYPNPATHYLNIQCKTTQSQLKIELYNIAGQKVLNETVYNHSKLPVQSYPRGMYLIKISDNDKIIQTEKVYFK